MALKIIKSDPRLARILLTAATVACLIVAWSFIKWNFANTIASRMDTNVRGADQVADWLTKLAPTDPQTHLVAAQIYEKTLDPDDLARALSEYEAAAAVAPFDYMRWLDLGKARSLSGDDEGARQAYTRAIELAPNYAAVQWTYGNFLIRSGNVGDGFALIAKAAASNPDYSRPAVTTALQVFDGDVPEVRRALGDTDGINASLAAMLAFQKRFDEASDVWSRLSADAKQQKFKQFGISLVSQMALAGKFQPAAHIAADLQPGEAEKPVIGQVLNGGFENGVKLRDATLFEWQIADGTHPQIGLVEGQSHSGRYSMFMLFDTFQSAAFRSVSQTVAVVPEAEYEFEAFYKFDLKTPASLKWEIVAAATKQTIAGTPNIAPAADWTSLRTTFTIPAGVDGIVIRLAREGCTGPSCPMNGKVSFDDFSLRRL